MTGPAPKREVEGGSTAYCAECDQPGHYRTKHHACAWCGLPAAEHVHVGTRHTFAGPEPQYAWLCSQCVRETSRDREVTVHA